MRSWRRCRRAMNNGEDLASVLTPKLACGITYPQASRARICVLTAGYSSHKGRSHTKEEQTLCIVQHGGGNQLSALFAIAEQTLCPKMGVFSAHGSAIAFTMKKNLWILAGGETADVVDRT